ncbi:hypothetical protein KC19_VG034700 [Ceratodon purpureus]|uniref:Uncharacterized protein n=1 Tax=Ceratodon purpureus TaxID=3225 RepID=A0A8T0HLN0_CERPU|nr:hypothetical protein KC19_VG034700 [Ceratodon purpureus]
MKRFCHTTLTPILCITQAAANGHMRVMLTYLQRPPYMHPWWHHLMYSSSVHSAMVSAYQMQYLFRGYQLSQVAPQQSPLTPILSLAQHMVPFGVPCNSCGQGSLNTNVV